MEPVFGGSISGSVAHEASEGYKAKIVLGLTPPGLRPRLS